MEKIRIIKATDVTYPRTGRHLIVEASLGKHSVVVMVAPEYVQVIVQNAAHRAWRGIGKRYATAAAAVTAFKTPAVRQIVQTITDAYSAKAAA